MDLNVSCNSQCCENSQFKVSEEDLMDIRKNGMLNKKHDDFVRTTYFIWGSCFGATICLAMVYFI
jgi:hypothetical protein